MTDPIIEPRFIAIEGAIGAGKTSLAKLLGKQFDAKVFLEKDEENPFIEKFYQDQESHAFHTQIFFLLSRYNQYLDLAQRDLFNSVFIIDYLFQRNRIFSNLTLKGHEIQL